MIHLTWADRVIEGAVLFLLVFTPLAFGTVEPWSEAIAEVVVLGLGVTYLIANVRNWELRVKLPSGWVFAASFLGLVVLQAAIPLSVDPHATLRHGLKSLAVAAFFLVCYNTYRTSGQARRAIWTMIAMTTFVAVLGVVQRMTWTGRLYWIGPEAPRSELYTFGPFINRTHFAGLVVIVVPLALGLMLATRSSPRRPSLVNDWASRLRRWNSHETGPASLIPLCIIVMGGAALISGSRGGVLSLLAVLLLMLAMGIRKRTQRTRGAQLLLVVMLVFVAAYWIGAEILFGTVERLAAEVGSTQDSFRLAIWPDALTLWQQAPIIGTGLGTFGVAFAGVRTLTAPVTVTHAESDWIQLLTDTGMLGLLLAVGCVVSCALSLVRAYRRDRHEGRSLYFAGFVALLGTALQGVANYNLPVLSNLFYLALAVAVASSGLIRGAAPLSAPPGNRR